MKSENQQLNEALWIERIRDRFAKVDRKEWDQLESELLMKDVETLLSENTRLTALLSETREALEKARHALVTQNGLWASDEGDPIMITPDVVWQLDNDADIKAIDAALSRAIPEKAK